MIFTLTGPSCSGKSTVLHYLVKNYPKRFRAITTATTRSPRRFEKDGKDYFFEEYPSEGFNEWRGFHVAPVMFGENLYGIPIHQMAALLRHPEQHFVVILEWQGALAFKKMFPNVRNVYIKVQHKKLVNRLSNRKQDGTERLIIDREAGIHTSVTIPYDFILRNKKRFRNTMKSMLDYIEQETGEIIRTDEKHGGTK